MDVSGFGSKIRLTATSTFPNGIDITQFADDADPIDIPSIQIGDAGKGLNGDLVFWTKAAVRTATVNVVPGSDDDKNLQILAENNRPEQGKTPAKDVITLVVTYGDGSTLTLKNGGITDAMFGQSVASAGRNKSKAYAFKF